MKLKCNDGIIREFDIAHADGDYLLNGSRQEGFEDAICIHCGKNFGCHDTKILKPKFRKHVCKRRKENDV